MHTYQDQNAHNGLPSSFTVVLTIDHTSPVSRAQDLLHTDRTSAKALREASSGAPWRHGRDLAIPLWDSANSNFMTKARKASAVHLPGEEWPELGI